MLVSPTSPFLTLYRVTAFCGHLSFCDSNQPNNCLNINCDLLLKQNSKTAHNFMFVTLWTWKRNRLFKIMKNANVCHLEVVVKRKLAPGGVYSFMALSKDHKSSKFNLRIYVEIFMMSLKMKFYCLNWIMF